MQDLVTVLLFVMVAMFSVTTGAWIGFRVGVRFTVQKLIQKGLLK